MAAKLELRIWNLQELESKKGKKYTGRTVCAEPGQSGRLSEAAVKPPFYVRDQRKKLGKEWLKLNAQTIQDAKVEALDIQNILSAATAGLAVKEAEAITEGDTLKGTITEYLDEIEVNKARKSWLAYKNSLENFFSDFCKKRFVRDVNRKDMIEFKKYLQDKEGVSPRSVYNHFLNTMIFFKWAKHNMEVKGGEKGDWPPKPERDADAYTDDEIKKLMRAADTENGERIKKNGKEVWAERLVLFSFLLSGLRSGELSHLTYGDIDEDTSVWKVQEKDGWNPKTKSGKRDVAVDPWLTEKILEHKNGFRDTDFVFSQLRDATKPDHHLLRIVKKVAKRAGLTGRFDDHKFRSTWITNQLRTKKNTDLDIAKWAGHGDTNTLKRYYKMLSFEDAASRAKATAANSKYAGMGD
jgi:integrase